MTLESNMGKLGQAVEERHFPNIKTAAHSLKGASGYIGASRVHYACFYIQENFVNNNHEEMLDYYPALIEAVVEFKITSRQMLAKHKSKF